MHLVASPVAAPGDGELVYERIAADVERQIADRSLKPGTRLLSERDLAEYYGVAYATIRRATKLLRDKGLIRTVHGRGTFVTGGR